MTDIVLDPTLVPPAPDVPAPPAPEAPAPGVEGQEPTDESPEEKRRRRRFFLLFFLLGLLLILIGLIIWYLLFRQPIPLPLPTIIEMPSYTTSMYGATTPLGVAVSPDGSRVYVAQTEGDRVVLIFDGSGNVVGTAQPGQDTGAEHVPVWLALDPLTSELYVSDRPTGHVYVYDRDGNFLRTFVLAVPNPDWQPMGLAFDATGNLYVANLAGLLDRVEKYDRSGNLVRTFGEGDHLAFPNGVAVDKDGNVFVADSNNGRLMAYRPDGTPLGIVGRGVDKGKLGMPRGVAVDGRNRIYVGDATGQGVSVMQLKIDPAPQIEYLGFFGGPGIEDGRFSFPNGVAADSRGRLYVADSRNNRVQMWSY